MLNQKTISTVFYWIWFLVMCAVAYADDNINFLLAFFLWLVLVAYVEATINSRSKWTYITPINQLYEFLRVVNWRHLLLLSLSLFVIGNLFSGAPTTTITLISGDNVRLIRSNELTWHVPFVEKVDVWKQNAGFFRNDMTFATLDGKYFRVDVAMDLRLSTDYSLIEDYARRFGNQQKYEDTYYKAVYVELDRIFSKMTFEQIATMPTLLLEDYVGSNIDLSNLGLERSGIIVIDDIEVVVGN